MPAPPQFAQRVARIPALLATLASFPEGLTLGDLAERFGTDARTVREDLTTYLDIESWGWSFDIFRRSQVEFVAPDEEADDSASDAATVVRVVSDDPAGLGAEHLSAGDLAALYSAGMALLDVDPDDDLAAGLAVISETMYGEDLSAPAVSDQHRLLAPLKQAQTERRRVRILYSRQWREGVLERAIEPVRLLQTHRGWEVDAGPVGDDGNLRTYLLSNVRDVVLLDETFEPPAGAEHLLEAKRRTTGVVLELTQEARWAADMYAEEVEVVDEDDETFTARLELLPPVAERIGLLLLASGPETRVVRPAGMLQDAVGVVEELLRHHEAAPAD